MGILVQVISTILLCISCMNMGIILGWPSSTILLFKSENTTLHRIMTDTEIALLTSVPAFGSMIANPIGAYLIDRLGRKYTTTLSSLIYVMFWACIALSNRVEAVLSAMFLGGFGCSVFLEASIYISEITQDSIRGAMTAFPNQFYCFGFLVSYLLGGALGYYAMVYTCLSLAVLGVLMISVLKESPVNLMAKGREAEAAKSIAFYRSTKSNSMDVVNEMNNIRKSLNPGLEDTQSLTKRQAKMDPDVKTKKVSCWQFYKTTPATRRQFYLVLVLNLTYICQGLPVVQVYAEPIFTSAIDGVISPNLCSIILGVVILIAGIVAAYLTDVLGRRPLQIYSSVAAGIFCIILGTQMITEVLPKWTIPLIVYAFSILHTVGAGTVPFVMLAEVFLPEVKSTLTMIVIEISCIFLFLYLFLFNLVIDAVGIPPVFFFFSLVCFATSVYFYYFLPETKGLPVYAIQELFNNKIKI